MHLDFLKICRTCRREITDNYYVLQESMYDMILTTTGVMVDNQDKLPHQICNVCHRAMQFAYSFRFECQKVDALLRSYENENQIINAESIINSDRGENGHPTEIKHNEPSPGIHKQDASVPGDHSHDLEKKAKQYFSCKLCPWKCEVYRSIITHYIFYHTSRAAPHQCPLCNSKLKHKSALRIHLKRHTVQTYRCQYCGIHYGDLFTLRRHLRQHVGARPFQCTVCGKSFKQRETLKIHFQRHAKIRNFKYGDCPKKTLHQKDDFVRVKVESIEEEAEVHTEPLAGESIPESYHIATIKREIVEESQVDGNKPESENSAEELPKSQDVPDIKEEVMDSEEELH